MNTPQSLIYNLLFDDVKNEYREYVSVMRGVGLKSCYNKMRHSYPYCSKLSKLTNDQKICYSNCFMDLINSGIYDEDALLIPEAMLKIREKLPIILLPEREVVKPKMFICECYSRIKNSPININQHMLGIAHKRYMEKQKLLELF